MYRAEALEIIRADAHIISNLIVYGCITRHDIRCDAIAPYLGLPEELRSKQPKNTSMEGMAREMRYFY